MWVHKEVSRRDKSVYVQMNIKTEGKGESFLICGGVVDIFVRKDILPLVDEQRKIWCRELCKTGNLKIRELNFAIKKFLGWDKGTIY